MIKGLLTLSMIAGTGAAAWFLPATGRHHYSETGVVYTTEYLTLRLPGGVVGFPPGTRMWARFNIHVPDREVVTNGKYTLAIDPVALTHDVEYAQGLADADQQNQDQTVDGIERNKARCAANQHAAELVAAADIEGINASLASSSTVGNYDTSLHRPASMVGAYGSYGGGGGGGGYVSSGTVINNVNVTQNNFGGGSPRRGASAAFVAMPGKVAGPLSGNRVDPAARKVAGIDTMSTNP